MVNSEASLKVETPPKEPKLTLAELQQEMAHLDNFKIQRRKDGTYWLKLAIYEPLEAIEALKSDTAQRLRHNRVSLLDYIKSNVDSLKNKKFPLRSPVLDPINWDDPLLSRASDGLPQLSAEMNMGFITQFRITEVDGREELHAEFKPRKGSDPKYFMNEYVCPAMMTYQFRPGYWKAKDVSCIWHFFMEREGPLAEVLEKENR